MSRCNAKTCNNLQWRIGGLLTEGGEGVAKHWLDLQWARIATASRDVVSTTYQQDSCLRGVRDRDLESLTDE